MLALDREDRKRDPAWRRKHAIACKSFLPFYATEILRGPDEYGGKFLLGPHHMEWGHAINSHNRILALASRDHGKSFFFDLAYPLWKADRVSPGQLGYIFSATREQAQHHLDKIRREVIGGGELGGGDPNPKLAHLRPLRKDSAGAIIFANGSEIRARGFGSRVRGGHPKWLVGDDVGNDEWIWSDLMRKKGIDYFLSAIEPMVGPGGQLVIVSTPFHAQDLYKHLENTGEFYTMRHPAIVNGGPLWPARYGMDELDRRKRMRSSIQWSREYMCLPITDDASIFPSYLFEVPGVKQPYPLGLPIEHWRSMGCECYGGVDLAMSSSASADYFVFFVMAQDPRTKERYVVDIIRRKGLGYQQQVDLIVNVAKKYECGLVFVEANQYQRVITDMIVRSSDIPIKAFYTTGKRGFRSVTTQRRGMKQTYSASKNALDQGVPALRMLFENGKIKIPWAPETRDIVQEWIGELQAFGWAEGKLQGVGAHDDTVIAQWICDHAIQVAGGLSLGTEEEAQAALALGRGNGEPEPDFFGSTAPGEDEEWRPKPSMPGPWGG